MLDGVSTGSINSYIYLAGDPWMSKHGHCNNSEVGLSVNLHSQLDKTNWSDYSVLPQVNVYCEADNIVTPGYYNSTTRTAENIDVDTTRNYLLDNLVSEGHYAFDVDFIPNTGTTLYGLGQFRTKTSELYPLYIPLEAGNSYVYNLNGNIAEGHKLKVILQIDPNALIQRSPIEPVTNNVRRGLDKSITITIGPNSEEKAARFKVNADVSIVGIKFEYEVSATRYPVLPDSFKFYSMGLYKDLVRMDSPNIKLQTVYRFKEVDKSCLDKNYNYDGGYPCSGYQQLAGTYEVEDL